ncbi:MAG: acetate/propionate family kinase [Patescibacteria group bacterium]
MSNILVINSGSTSVKYKLFNKEEKQLNEGCVNFVENYELAVKQILRELKDLREIDAIGHRVVHGGDKYIEPTLISGEVIKELEKYNSLAPLHNPFNLAGIKACLDYLPNIKQVAVFDTSFYSELPPVARNYALPKEIIKRHKIRRFGFHGISHKYVFEEAAKQLKRDVEKVNLITCHLGGGWSITAIKKGQAIDTSMGWTPLEGLIMMTRAGDLDPGIIMELIKDAEDDFTGGKYKEIINLLNYESGIKAISEGIDDYQELLKEVSQGQKQAKLAFEMAVYRLSKYIGAYWTILEGKVDAIVFTGAIGAGNPMTRNAVMSRLKCLGEIKVFSIKTNEELMIARETRQILNRHQE